MLAPALIVRLQLALTAAAGALDVFCVTRLGGPFASVITGNLVQVGSSVVGRDFDLTVSCVVAVAAYAAGVAAGAIRLRDQSAGWSVLTTLVVLAEFVLIGAVTVGWRLASANPGRSGAALLLGLAAAAMGLQSSATVTSGISGAATTYLTGTLTAAVRTMVTVPHGLATGSKPLLRLLALLVGAVAGGLMQHATAAWAPILPAAIVGGVVTIAAVAARAT